MLNRSILCAVMVVLAALVISLPAGAHCDTIDGPVVKDAVAALEKKDVTPVLKWVSKEHEPEIKEAFLKTLKVRSAGPEARELADNYFFETLVRVHRVGEGAPYTGLKPAGTDPGPGVAAADKACESGSCEAVVKQVEQAVAKGIRDRFAQVMEKRMHVDDSPEAGREYVEAYVEFIHYVEGLYNAIAGASEHETEEIEHSKEQIEHKH